MGSHVVVFCFTNRNPERKDHWKYNILAIQVHAMMQILFLAGDGIFQDDNAPTHVMELVESWFDEHEKEVKYLPLPAQSPDLNMIEPLWSILELSIRNRYPPQATIPRTFPISP
ncbi:DDE_3 domain-containing protein [Trichonephila clavipes]|nr:DDE_3 domain-containing protein [Trichonephila clavipes]